MALRYSAFLNVGQPGPEFFQARGEKLRAFALEVRVRVFGHEQEKQLWILWRSHAVYGLQVLEFWAMRNGNRADPAVCRSGRFVKDGNRRDQQ